MVQPSAITACEDAALDEARPLSRGPRMDPQLSQQLRTRLQSLSDQAVRMTIPNGTSPTAMKSRILRVAAELGLPMTIRRVSSGLLCWHSSDADMHHAREIANRLQTAQRGQHARQGRGRRRTSPQPRTSRPRYIPRSILICSRHPKSLKRGWRGCFSYGEDCLGTLLSMYIYYS